MKARQTFRTFCFWKTNSGTSFSRCTWISKCCCLNNQLDCRKSDYRMKYRHLDIQKASKKRWNDLTSGKGPKEEEGGTWRTDSTGCAASLKIRKYLLVITEEILCNCKILGINFREWSLPNQQNCRKNSVEKLIFDYCILNADSTKTHSSGFIFCVLVFLPGWI